MFDCLVYPDIIKMFLSHVKRVFVVESATVIACSKLIFVS
jgi:hypothetical protein